MGLDPRHISACLITKDPVYPPAILEALRPIGFGEILIETNCPSLHHRYQVAASASKEYVYVQDDDCLAPIPELLALPVDEGITCAMKPGHLAGYRNTRIALVGWGAIFPTPLLGVLDQYRTVYGEDALFQREADRIFTYLNFPQRRLALPIEDLPSAWAPDRMWREPTHAISLAQVEARCAALMAESVPC